jgi:CRP/FNR family cyclic AMP-dependent transcriptional regulator
MILPGVRLWYEGKSKELEDVLREAESCHLNGYARSIFQGSGQSFIVLHRGSVREILEIGPTNKPVAKTLRDLWGKSKIKEGILQVFEIPPETELFLSRISQRRSVIPAGSSIGDLKKLILQCRKSAATRVVDLMTTEGKGLLILENKEVLACAFSEQEGFTITGMDAFKRLVAAISRSAPFQAFSSAVSPQAADGPTPWLPLLLSGAEHSVAANYLKNRLIEKYGHHYGPGTLLFREGDAGNDFYLIVSGRVAIYKEREGRRKILAELGAGEFFGEMAIFNNAPRTASAETAEDCLLVRIGKDELKTLLFNSYDFRINMVKKLVRRLKDTNDEMVKLWEDPRAVYLEKIIFQILGSDQKWQDEGIPPGLLMQEISNSSGMRFSEIDSVFRKFLERGKIEFVRGKVVLKEPSSLP